MVFNDKRINRVIEGVAVIRIRNVKMLFRLQSKFSLFLRRIPIFQPRIYASSTAPHSDEEWEQDPNNKDETGNETSVS